MRSLQVPAIAAVVLALLAAAPSRAEDSRVELGVRANAMHISQSLAEQMIGVGVVWRYHVRDDWFVAFSLDSYQYDINDPLGSMGVAWATAVSMPALPVHTGVFSTVLGKSHGIRDSGFDWFWNAGIGLGIASVSNASGVTENGQAYDLHAETGAQIHLSATLGTAYYFSPRWALIAAGRAEYQFVDLQLSDHVSGESYVVDSLLPIGVSVSLSYRF